MMEMRTMRSYRKHEESPGHEQEGTSRTEDDIDSSVEENTLSDDEVELNPPTINEVEQNPPNRDEVKQSPNPHVQSIVSMKDDPNLPTLTCRMWVLGISACALQGFLQARAMFYKDEFDLALILVYIMTYGMGWFMAALLPNKAVNVPFTGGFRFALNPEPFNTKEHVLLLSFGFVGLFFNWVSSPVMGWPSNLLEVIFFRTLHGEIDELIASLPPSCRAGRAIWMANVPLLNFPMVQMHMPDRVMRQFGLRQTILAHCNCRQPPHGKNWKAGQKDYRQDHHAELEMWNHRLNHIVPAGEADPHEYAYPADDPYVTWYERITIPYISRLGGGMDKAV
ncbi:hypothetical protein RHMOL_Rhmol04G0289700 [Rhododendron molle]|uniref:Uncharacterized protein n=1 Tax=Rhododendron molle TaxID=49168 RepID=A0ACC0P761_RHOML|nr:hypothetical protein RHMOL_Rhmol04G0289700 [Rhododendron molle]